MKLTELNPSLFEGLCELFQLFQIGHLFGIQIGSRSSISGWLPMSMTGRLVPAGLTILFAIIAVISIITASLIV